MLKVYTGIGIISAIKKARLPKKSGYIMWLPNLGSIMHGMRKTHTDENKISGCVNQGNDLVRAMSKIKKPDFITKIWL